MVKYLKRGIYIGFFYMGDKEELLNPVEQVAKHQNKS
jgi:hypothetical protein